MTLFIVLVKTCVSMVCCVISNMLMSMSYCALGGVTVVDHVVIVLLSLCCCHYVVVIMF